MSGQGKDNDEQDPDELPHYSDKGGHRERGDFWRKRRSNDRQDDFRSRTAPPIEGGRGGRRK